MAQIACLVIASMLFTTIIILNIISSRIFTRKRFKKPIYRYLKAISIVDALFLLLLILFVALDLMVSQNSDNNNNTKLIKNCRLYVIFYLARVSFLISSLISIKITFDRCLFLFKRKYDQITKYDFYRSIFLFTIFSFLFFLPHILLTEIKDLNQIKDNKTQKDQNFGFRLSVNDYIANNQFAMYFFMFIQYIPNVICSLLMIGLCVLIYLKADVKGDENENYADIVPMRYLIRAGKTTISYNIDNSSDSSCKFKIEPKFHNGKKNAIETRRTLMVFFISIAFLISQIINAIGLHILYKFNVNSIEYSFAELCIIFIAFCVYSSNFVIYYIFDTRFKYEL